MKHLLVVIPFLSLACSEFPKNPEKTLAAVQGQTLKVGIRNEQ